MDATSPPPLHRFMILTVLIPDVEMLDFSLAARAASRFDTGGRWKLPDGAGGEATAEPDGTPFPNDGEIGGTCG